MRHQVQRQVIKILIAAVQFLVWFYLIFMVLVLDSGISVSINSRDYDFTARDEIINSKNDVYLDDSLISFKDFKPKNKKRINSAQPIIRKSLDNPILMPSILLNTFPHLIF